MAIPASNVAPGTGDARIAGLLQGSAWQFNGPRVITYSFSLNDAPGSSWTAELQTAVSQAFAVWSTVANITFAEAGSGTVVLTSSADIAMAPVGADLGDVNALGLGFFPPWPVGAASRSLWAATGVG